MARFAATRTFHCLVLILAGFILYGFTIDFPFVYDSRAYIMKNPLIRSTDLFFSLRNIDEFMETYLLRLADWDIVTSFASRPVGYLTFHVNYLLGGTRPGIYRVSNIILHITNAILLYHVMTAIILRRENRQRVDITSIPLFIALLFLVHPMQTESVTYIVQRFTSLGVLFSLAAIALYIKSCNENGALTLRWSCYCGSVLALVLGLMSRESIITMPLILVMLELILFNQPWLRTIKRLSPHLAAMSIVPLLVQKIYSEVDKAGLLEGSTTNFGGSMYGRAEYAITQIRVILSYFRLLVLPYNQNFVPNYPLYKSLLDPEIVLSIAIWIFVLSAGVLLLRRKERTLCSDLAAFSIFSFPVAMLASSSLIPLPDLMSEHRAHIASMFFCTGSVAYLFHLISGKNRKFRYSAIGLLSAVVVIFGMLTVQRNYVYRSRIALWKDSIKKNPEAFGPTYALAYVFTEKGQHHKAIRQYKKAMTLDPSKVETYISLGCEYVNVGLVDEAIQLYNRYLESYQSDTRLLTNLALAYVQQGNLKEAIDIIKVVLLKRPYDQNLLSYMSELNLMAGNIEDARHYLSKARLMDGEDPTTDLSTTLDKLERKIQEELPESG